MHIFPLNPKKHADFLKQERKDPITGDAFKAGDEVVFCAACRSAFLRESWEFMEGKHCNQEETLESFPKAQKNLALVHKKQQLYPKPLTIKEKTHSVIFTISILAPLTGACSIFLVITNLLSDFPLLDGLAQVFSYLLLPTPWYFVAITGLYSYVPRKVKSPKFFRFINLNSQFIRYAKFGIPRRLRLSTLTHLYVTHELVGYINAKRHYFTFTFHTPGKKRSVQVEVTNEEHDDMLEALVLLSKQTAVTVGVRYQREYDFLTAKKEEYQAPIEIEILD